jgi:hypothetical protein
LFGRGLVIRARASGHQPKELLMTAHPAGAPDQAVTLPMFDKGSVGYHQLLDNVREGMIVFVHTRDRVSVSKQCRVGVILTPQLDQARLRIVPPPYTGLAAEERLYDFKPIKALAGSRLEFRLRSNRPLREGLVELSAGPESTQRLPLAPSATNGRWPNPGGCVSL